MKIEHIIGLIVILLMAIDLLYTHKQVFGKFPWES